MEENYNDVTLITPTLNEGGNIGKLLNIVTKLYPGISVIVSDDGSKDKTCSIVKSYSLKNKKIKLLDRKNKKIKGLTISVVDAISNTKTPIFVVIDGDLQHPPEKIKEIVESLREGNDLVVGCRKKLSSEWPMYRVIMSRIATDMGKIKLILKRRNVSDIMSGFFGAHTSKIKELINTKQDQFELTGYKVLFDILDLYHGKLKTKEIYYDFNIRENGKSKMGNKQIMAYIKSLFRL